MTGDLWRDSGRLPAEEALREQLGPMPEGLLPIVVCGGSFNSAGHHSRLRAEDRAFLDALLEKADPEKVCFAVGHTLAAQEGYLVRQAAGRFRVVAIVPAMITAAERTRLRQAGVTVRVALEPSPMGLYKSFAYEIFKRTPSALLAFDGNSAAMNLVQEARNGRRKCRIFVSPRSRGLAVKARTLEGYVRPMGDPAELLQALDAQ